MPQLPASQSRRGIGLSSRRGFPAISLIWESRCRGIRNPKEKPAYDTISDAFTKFGL